MQAPSHHSAPPAPMTHTHGTGWRKDIQLLRAIAVLFVVIYHAEFDILPGGFLGVDVFFVVSGFLMTRILVTELRETERIRLIPFFLRRARRLMPAATVTAFVTGLASLVIYTQDRFAELGKFMFGALFFISNILFYRAESDYFATEQNANPFLHFWSLSVEEQFYFIFPLFLRIVILGGKVIIIYIWVNFSLKECMHGSFYLNFLNSTTCNHAIGQENSPIPSPAGAPNPIPNPAACGGPIPNPAGACIASISLLLIFIPTKSA